MSNVHNIAVLLTCFNRRQTTLSCLRRLFELDQKVDVFLVDDLSSDGTSASVSSEFPQVHVISGTGDLFWNRGMYLAWEHASSGDYSKFLWLNDDVILYDHCLCELLECSAKCNDTSIITGIVESLDHSETLYGGTDSQKRLLPPNGSLQPVINMNGNVVLVPRSVFTVLGNLDQHFHHDLGDVDYGLRAKQNGINVVTTRVAVGSCERNDVCRVRLWNTTLSERFRKLYSPLGNHPSINFYFRHKHYGILNALAYFAFIHGINILPDWVVARLFGSTYVPRS
jgi:GT2 family glycosyltransferase